MIPTDPTERGAWLQERLEYCATIADRSYTVLDWDRFIASARTALPLALAEIERLDARVRELEELAGKKEWRIGGLPPEFQGLPYRDAASARSDMALEAHHKRFTMWLECRTGPGPWVKAE